jgi:hypothetical protein
MTRIETRLAYLAIAICLSFAGCGNKKDVGADVDMGVQGTGLIIGTDVASCVDKIDGTTRRSVTKNALVFANFSLTYRGTGKSLFVGALSVTVKSPNISGGEITIVLSSEELSVLLDSEGQTITVPDGSTSITVNSNSTTRNYPSCQLAVGGINFTNKNTTSFTATVEIKMVGSAVNNTTGDVERVEETIQATAEY